MKTIKQPLYQDILDTELKASNITVIKWSVGSNGYAQWNSRNIKIPKPLDADRLGVCFHEIAHIVLSHGGWAINKQAWLKEYEAEQWAIMKFAQYNILDKEAYIERARRHVIMVIAKAYYRRFNLNKLSAEVINFCGIDFSQWEGKKVFVDNWWHDKGELEIKFIEKAK